MSTINTIEVSVPNSYVSDFHCRVIYIREELAWSLLTEKWINRMLHIWMVEYYAVMKMN